MGILLVGIAYLCGKFNRCFINYITKQTTEDYIVELLSIVALGYVFYDALPLDWHRLVSNFLLMECCLIVSIIDIKEGYIYLNILIGFCFLRFIVVSSLEELGRMVIASLVAMGLYMAIYLLGKCLFRKEAMGLGDIYYLTCLALWFEWYEVILVGLGAFWVGLIIVILYYIRWQIRLERLAFAPMISIACVLIYFYGDEVIYLYGQLFL